MPTKRSGKGPKSPTEKLLAYDTSAVFNQTFAHVLQNLRKLEELGLLPRAIFIGLQVALEETRAWATVEVVEMLHGREESDWARFGRLRRQWEKKYEDPKDILLKAARVQKPPQKSAGKRRRRS